MVIYAFRTAPQVAGASPSRSKLRQAVSERAAPPPPARLSQPSSTPPRRAEITRNFNKEKHMRYGRDFGFDDARHIWSGGENLGYRGGGRTYQRGLDIGPTWGGGSDIGYGTYRSDRVDRHRGLDSRDRMVFRAGGAGYDYDRDFGDRVREGWHDLKRGVQRAFGGGYDEGYSSRGSGFDRFDRNDRFDRGDRFERGDRFGYGDRTGGFGRGRW